MFVICDLQGLCIVRTKLVAEATISLLAALCLLNSSLFVGWFCFLFFFGFFAIDLQRLLHAYVGSVASFIDLFICISQSLIQICVFFVG